MLEVSADGVYAKASQVQREAALLESQIAALTSDMAALAEAWTGAASRGFHGICHSWQAQVGGLLAQLEEIGRSLNAADER